MPEFTYAVRFEIAYWTDQQALCLNFLTNWKPEVKFKLTTNNKFGQCSKKIINCLDDFSNWTDLEAKFLETCRQSSGTDYKLWEWEPIEKEEERYFLGNETYTPNYCWPGASPFYSPILLYPDNILLGINELYTEIDNFVKDATYILNENSRKAGIPTEVLDAVGGMVKSVIGERKVTEEEMKQIYANNNAAIKESLKSMQQANEKGR